MFTALACCVFLWGLQYKLSLYYPHQAPSHHVPMAKLLSKNEESNTQEISKYTQSKPAIKALLTGSSLLLFILIVVCTVSMAALSVRAAAYHPSLELLQALRETFSIRPPPFHSA
jgi:hypothetical protein